MVQKFTNAQNMYFSLLGISIMTGIMMFMDRAMLFTQDIDVGKRLGAGKFGSVYVARCRRTGRHMPVLPAWLAGGPSVRLSVCDVHPSTHPPTHACMHPSIDLHICHLSISLYLVMSVCPSNDRSIDRSTYLPIYPPAYLLCRSVELSVCGSIDFLSICLSIYPSIGFLSICLSIYLSICVASSK